MIGIVDGVVRAVTGAPVAVDGDEVELPPGVEVRLSRLIPVLGGRLSGMRGHAAAVALGRTILVHPAVRATPRLLRHELEHVRQWERHPHTFPLRYIWSHIRHGYAGNPFEVEARAAENR